MKQERFSPSASSAAPHESVSVPMPCLAPACPCRSHIVQRRQQVGYWRAMHHNAVIHCNSAQQAEAEYRAWYAARKDGGFELVPSSSSKSSLVSGLPTWSPSEVSGQVVPARPSGTKPSLRAWRRSRRRPSNSEYRSTCRASGAGWREASGHASSRSSRSTCATAGARHRV